MSLEDIERLKEKVNKDPHSKLFIPLAEEYKKAGMFDEAIDVLNKGLEAQPGYMSARVSLGKIYFDRGMLEEARAEFEKVINAIPDNLYAHKKLAEIYRDLGERDKAVKEFKIVLKLNPMDEWAATNLSDVEEGTKPKKPEPVKAEQPVGTEPKPVTEKGEEKPPEISVDKDITEGLDELLAEAVEETEEVQTEPVTETAELTEEEPLSFEGILKESEVVFEPEDITAKEEVSEPSEHPALKVQDADPYITEGKYMEAMNIYRKLLSTEPDNMHLMQRIEEMKALLKLLGKDKEELIARLDSLLEGIKKRRNEFFGSA
jgi:tetratricopeptide (TPR) repeat protein